MSRPKDLEPTVFAGKEEEWPKWKEGLFDYAEAVQPGLKWLLEVMGAKAKEAITPELCVKHSWCNQEEWKQAEGIYTLLTRKTAVCSEPRKIIMCIPRDNGFEAWRNLCMRYEPQTGIRRMKEIAELTLLQNMCPENSMSPK